MEGCWCPGWEHGQVVRELWGPGGPLAELPIMAAGAWHYVSPDYFPLAALGVDPAVGWSGLASITAPCYFAVTTDAIALGRWFSEGIDVGEG